MTVPRLCLLALVACILLLSACQDRSSAPLAPSAADPTATIFASPDGSLREQLVAGFTVTVDAASLTATAEPWRQAEGFQANLFDLDINAFQSAESFRLTGVRSDPDGNPILDYTHAHPFAAPNFAQPVTGLNRADLGYTGRILFVSDLSAGQVPSFRFFGGVVANTAFVQNPDGYVSVGDLLANGEGLRTTAHPYRLIVDEVRNNRVGVSNAGSYTGSFDTALGGWQRSNIGASSDGWTGYDYLHQGQVARGFVTLRKEAFVAGTATFTTAILIRYCDPRGNKDKANRFPADPADVKKFAYRLPHAALDGSKIALGGLTLTTATGSNGPLTVRVRDWDARATVTSFTDLGEDPNISTIRPNTGGIPQVNVSVPALADGVFAATEDAPPRSGLPGDELRYTAIVTNVKGTAPPGLIWGLVRVADPQDADPEKQTYHFGVDPVTLAGSAIRALPVTTYQAAPILITPPPGSEPQCNSTGINGSGMVAPGGTFTVNLATITDTDSAFIGLQFRYTGPGEQFSSTLTLNTSALVLETAFNPFTDPRLTTPLFPPVLPGTYQLTLRLTDGTSEPVDCGPYLFTVQADFPPQCNSGITLSRSQYREIDTVDFTVNLSALSDPGNPGPIGLTFAYTGPEADSAGPAQRHFPLPGNFDPFGDGSLPEPLTRPTAAGDYLFSVTLNDGVNDPVACTAPFSIKPCGTPKIVEDITTGPAFGASHDLNASPLDWYNFYTIQDFAAFLDGRAGVLFQRYDPADDPGNGAITDYNLWRVTDPGDLSSAVPVTSFLTAGNQVAQLETDRTGRILWFYRPFDDAWDTGSNYANPHKTLYWIDYTGTPATAVAGSLEFARPAVAMSIDVENGVWVIDRDNLLHHYRRQGTGYVLVSSDSRDLGAILGIGLTTVVCDFVINFHNSAFYILTNSGPSRNGRLYRLECDGVLWGGGTNPLNVALSTGAQYPAVPDGGDIAIDQLAANGSLLEGPQDVQILVFHSVAGGGTYVINADLQQTAASTGGTSAGVRGTIEPVSHWVVSNESGDLAAGQPWAFIDSWTLPGAWQ